MEKCSDISKVLLEAKRLSKKVKNESVKADIRIAVLGTVSIQHFVMVLRYVLSEDGIFADIYEGEYNGIEMDVLNLESDLYRFNPEFVIILTHYMDVKEYPVAFETNENVRALVSNIVNHYVNIWNYIERKLNNCIILQSNFVIPAERIYGSLESELCFSRSVFFNKLNEKLVERTNRNVQIIDLDYVASCVGKYNWFDYSSYFTSKLGFRLDYIVDTANCFANAVKMSRSSVKKCLVLDLDNTLWGGIVGDVGFDGIMLDPNNAMGEAYRYFQQYVLELKRRGVILAVCSKNEEQLAKEPFEKNENMILKLDDIACFVANWQDKATNIRNIANILNISVDSIVFFDDNPVERALVKENLKDVMVIDVPEDPANYVFALDKATPFDWQQITREDIDRNNSYVSSELRRELEEKSVDYNAYLSALHMKGIVKLLDKSNLSRFVQLINKSNQFNLRTVRYTEREIEEYIGSDENICLYGKLMDKFSEYGIISCVILKKNGNNCFIDTWVMSCRVLKRNVEYLMFNEIVQTAKDMGCSYITSEYIPTEKNTIVSELFDHLGFDVENTDDGVKKYIYKSMNSLNIDISIEKI